MVRDAITDIPVFANGNIRNYEDVVQCLDLTGVDAVMSANGLLDDPSMFDNTITNRDPVALARQYFAICEKPGHMPPLNYIRGHVFKMLFNEWTAFPDLRHTLQKSRSREEFKTLIEKCAERKLERPLDWSTHYLSVPVPVEEEEEETDLSFGSGNLFKESMV